MIKKIVRKLGRAVKAPVLDGVFGLLMKRGQGGEGRKPFGATELKLLYEALLSQNLCSIDGGMVRRLERQFAYRYGSPHAVASTSGTAAIHVALGALDLNPGDEVITAPITDLGTIIPILYQNAIPVFADIDATYNMDPADVERKITPETRAIIAVHLFGNPCDMDAMREIATRHRIPLIEDCAQAHLARYKGQYVGTLGDIGCFSFQQSKQMTTGDGGMTITANKQYAERMKLFADKGYARKGWGTRSYLFHAPNYRMTELVGAVGLAQLEKIEGVVARRAALGARMSERLKGTQGLTPAPVTPGAEHSYWLYPIRMDGMDLSVVAEALRAARIPVSVGYTGKPIYLCSESLTAKKTYGDSQWPFTIRAGVREYEYAEGLCPRAEETLDHLICIPWDESWTDEKVDRAADALEACVGKAMGKAGSVPRARSEAAPVPSGPAATAKGRVRVGIVGCGQIGKWHLEAYRKDPRASIVAVADTSFAAAEAFAREAGARPYRSHREMVEGETLDGVSVCTVPATHREIALDLLSAGTHVLCEKPLAVSGAQAEEMVKKARQAGLMLLPAFKFRFYDEVREAKRLVGSGSLGRIASFRLMFGGYLNSPGGWYANKELSGGGVIMDNGSHAADLIHHLFGKIDSVSAEAAGDRGGGVEDTATLSLRLRDGTVGTVDLSWSVPIPPHSYLEIYGEEGTALLDLEGIAYKFRTWSDWKRTPNRAGVEEAFARQITHFLDAILNKRPSVVGNGAGAEAQFVIDAAYESLRQERKASVVKYAG